MSAFAVTILMLLFFAWHVVLWIGACWFIAIAGGWRALAKRFPAHGAAAPGAVSGLLMIEDKWNGSIRVAAGRDGLAIAPAPIMSIGHPRIFVPWSAMTPLRAGESPVLASTHIHVDGTCVAFFGKAADLVAQSLPA